MSRLTLHSRLRRCLRESLSAHYSLIMCMDPADLRSRANWDGAAGSSREQLLIQLQGMPIPSMSDLCVYSLTVDTRTARSDYISPTVMLPQRRLATLLGQAQAYQQRHHAIPPSASEPFSLLTDADVQDTGAFPTATSHVLQDHSDEVWRLEWSHNGEWLATAGKDRTVMLWKVNVSSCYLLVRQERPCLLTPPLPNAVWLHAGEDFPRARRPRLVHCVVARRLHLADRRRGYHQDVEYRGEPFALKVCPRYVNDLATP